jgi:hypothetical protein
VDKNSLLSTLNKNSISLQPQQDTPYNVFLSPTIQLGSQGVLRRGSLVQIRGYSIAGSLINISLDYGKTLFQTTTNAEGYYEYFIDTTQLLEGEHTITTNTIKGADLSDSSRVVTFSVQTEEENFIPDIVVGPDKLPPPIVIAPEDGSTITGDTVVITGDATPGAQINVYENGKLISTVNTDKFGDWSFQYTARFSPVSLSFEACIDGRCSILSRDITLFFTGIASRCSEQFDLEEYRFWNIASNEAINLNLKSDLEGVLSIEWGDETYEKFSKDLNGETNFSHIYRSPSTYNGTIIFENNDCTYTKFFSVIVSNDNSDSSFWYLLIFVASLFLGSYLAYKDRSKEK